MGTMNLDDEVEKYAQQLGCARYDGQIDPVRLVDRI
jgi:hypothetical protein